MQGHHVANLHLIASHVVSLLWLHIHFPFGGAGEVIPIHLSSVSITMPEQWALLHEMCARLCAALT